MNQRIDRKGGLAPAPLDPATSSSSRDATRPRSTASSTRRSIAARPCSIRTPRNFSSADARFTYGTKGTPTTKSLEVAWSELTGAAGTVLLGSGLAAISLALMSCMRAGDHVLVTDSVYFPTRSFCDTILERFGVETTYYDPLIAADIAR